MYYYAVKFIAEGGFKFFRVAFYRVDRNKYFALYRHPLFVVPKGNDIGMEIMFQKLFIDVKKKFVGTKNNVQLLQRFFFLPEYMQHPAFNRRRAFNSETGKLVCKRYNGFQR
jgi:hypothetical protein